MQTLIIKEVWLSWASGRRRHNKGGGYINLYEPQISGLTEGDSYSTSPPAAIIDSKFFTLMIISGGINGPEFYTTDDLKNQKAVPSVVVGTAQVNVTSFYLLPGQPGPGGDPALCIDAFNVTTGDFIDDDFVSILQNGLANTAFSATANFDGVVDSVNAGLDVRAFDNFVTIYSPGSVIEKFDNWQSLSGTETIVKLDINVVKNTTAYYFALYHTPMQKQSLQVDIISLFHDVSDAIKRDGGGPPMWYELESFGAAISFSLNADLFSQELSKGVREIAAKQVMVSAEAISGKIMASGKFKEQ